MEYEDDKIERLALLLAMSISKQASKEAPDLFQKLFVNSEETTDQTDPVEYQKALDVLTSALVGFVSRSYLWGATNDGMPRDNLRNFTPYQLLIKSMADASPDTSVANTIHAVATPFKRDDKRAAVDEVLGEIDRILKMNNVSLNVRITDETRNQFVESASNAWHGADPFAFDSWRPIMYDPIHFNLQPSLSESQDSTLKIVLGIVAFCLVTGIWQCSG
jgi:hypothetical protein